MTKPVIKFGTDGWRAVIADTYTFDNLRLVSHATATWMLKRYPHKLKTVIGYDARFMGDRFARIAAQVLASRGIEVILADRIVSTPAVSYATRALDCGAGVVITASHNPPEYNGFKIKSEFGGPGTPEQITEVESEMAGIDPSTLSERPFQELVNEGKIVLRNIGQDYLDLVRRTIDIEAINASGITIGHDAMYGAAMGVMTELLSTRVVTLHDTFNPWFEGQAPEPIEKNLKQLAETVVAEGCAVGLANDGDADRIGLYDEKGQFVDSHRILSLLVKYMVEEKGMKGDIVRTATTTDMLAKMGAHYGLHVETTPVGFKYIASKMVEGDVLVGGEESGGLAVKGHIPERDGIFIGLLVVEMMVKRGKKLSELVDELFEQFGPHYAYRSDIHTSEEKKARFLKMLAEEGVKEAAGFKVVHLDTIDGYKYRTDADNWVMIRASGTEPVLRIYSEAADPETAKRLVDSVASLI